MACVNGENTPKCQSIGIGQDSTWKMWQRSRLRIVTRHFNNKVKGLNVARCDTRENMSFNAYNNELNKEHVNKHFAGIGRPCKDKLEVMLFAMYEYTNMGGHLKKTRTVRGK